MITNQCFTCRNFIRANGMVCIAFPLEIPAGIATGEIDHRKPYPGDNGIQYEPIEEPQPQ